MQKVKQKDRYDELKDEVDQIKLLMKSEKKAIIDRFEELKNMREADSMIGWFAEIRENIDTYREQMMKIKYSVEQLWEDEDNFDLNQLREKSGVTLKELAIFLEMDSQNLAPISKLISGVTNDKFRRIRAKNYMLKQIALKAKLQ